MRRFTKKEENILFIVRSTAEELKIGTWADCETINNRLSKCPRTEDGLKYKYKVMKKAAMKKRTSGAKWNAMKREVKDLLLGRTCNVSQICLYESIANR
jgi:hypothetical protein